MRFPPPASADGLPAMAWLLLLVAVRANQGIRSPGAQQPWRDNSQQQQHRQQQQQMSAQWQTAATMAATPAALAQRVAEQPSAASWLDPKVPTTVSPREQQNWQTFPSSSFPPSTFPSSPPPSTSPPPPPSATPTWVHPQPPPTTFSSEFQYSQRLWEQQQLWLLQQQQQQQQQGGQERDQDGVLLSCTSQREVCLPANYSRFQLPNKGGQTTVSIGFDGFDVRKIDDIEYTVEISCYFLTKWHDDRLLLHEDIAGAGLDDHGEEQWFPMDLEFVSKLWLPDVEVLNLKSFLSLNVLSKLQGLWVSQNSNILYVLASRITFICAMSFDAFPLDVQTCLLQVGSFNFDNRKMVFDSYLLPSMPNHTKSILDYDVHIDELKPEATYFVPAETGNYSVTGFEMTLTRRMSHYMITYYLPSSLFVVVSWTSFLIPSEDIQGRMALLVTLFLVLVNIFNTTTSNSPKADGLNAMQSWVICCIFFVFGALFEYAIILLQMKVKTFRKLSAPLQKDETCKLDMAVLIAFPIVFLIFNISYWAAFHL